MADPSTAALDAAAPARADAPPLRYLPSADIDDCLPEVAERLDLAAQALVALAGGDAEMPPKIGVHPRPGALLHAMPAWLRSADIVGLKWVAAFPENRQLGLAAISGLVVLNDPQTGMPSWIMEAGRITALRTAAVSGVAIRLLAPPQAAVAAVLGAGVQARSHLEMLASVLPGARILVFDRHPERAAAVAAEQDELRGKEWVTPAESVRQAVAEADVVVTVATLGASAERIAPDWLKPRALVVAVDFATYVDPSVAHAAQIFATDDREQFLQYRSIGYFDGYPEPAAMLGEIARDWPSRPSAPVGADEADAPVLVTHLGVGLADVVFADAIRQAAERQQAGIELPR